MRGACRRTTAIFATLVALTACEDQLPGAPVPTGIAPNRGLVGVPVEVVISGNSFVPRVLTEFNRGGGSVDVAFHAFLGATELVNVTLAPDGTLHATAPATLPPGMHSLRVVDPSGRSGELADAYLADSVTAFAFDAIGDQQVGVPFQVHARAVDADGAQVVSFALNADLRASNGVALGTADFEGGAWTGPVRIDTAESGISLSVTDAFERTGVSPVFAVRGLGAIALTGTADGVAGACLGPLTLERRDTAGVPLPSQLPLSVNVSVLNLSGAQVYASAGCSSAVSAVEIPAGEATTMLWVRGTLVGTGQVQASANGVAPVTVALNVSLGPLTRVVFLSASQTVAVRTCSAIVRVGLSDAFGNRGDTSGTVTADLSTAGLEAFGLFSDTGCTTPVSSLVFSSGLAERTFYFGGSAPGVADVIATIGSNPARSQAQTLTGTAPNFAFFTSTQSIALGRCSNILRLGTVIGGNPTPVMADAHIALVSTSPALAFYSDSSCTTQIDAVTLARGTSETSFFVRGTTPGNVGVDAVASGFNTIRQTQTLLGMTRQFANCVLPDGSASTTCNVFPAVLDVSRTLLTYGATSASAEPLDGQVRCWLSAANQVSCLRRGTTGIATISGTVTEFGEGWSSAVYEPPCPSPATDYTFALPSPVVPAKTFLLYGLTEKGESNSLNDFTMVNLQDASTVRFRYEIAGTAETCSSDGAFGAFLNVVQSDFITVTRGVTPAMTGGAVAVTGLPSAALGSSILLYSWRSSGTGFEMCERMVRGELDSPSSILFSRGHGGAGTACTGEPVEGISWERLDFGARARVQQLDVQLEEGELTKTLTLPSPVDGTRSIVLTGGQFSRGQMAGEGSLSDADIPGAMIARMRLLNLGSDVEATRGSGSGAARFTAYVVEFVP